MDLDYQFMLDEEKQKQHIHSKKNGWINGMKQIRAVRWCILSWTDQQVK